MITCPKCGNQLPDGAAFCNVCGTPIAQAAPQGMPQGMPQGVPGQQPMYQQPVMAYDPWDHTGEFDRQDVSDNKVFAMMPYLFGWLGIIVVMLAAQKSAYSEFHVRQYLKLLITSGLCDIVGGILVGLGFMISGAILAGGGSFGAAITIPMIFMFPLGVVSIIIFVLRLIGFFGVCSGKAKEIPIVRGFGFLR